MPLTGKKIILLGIIIVLLTAIPLTAYLVQQQQETRSQAKAATVLSFSPSSSQGTPVTKNVGDVFTLDIMIDPGTNEVIHTTLSINFDSTKLATANAALSPAGPLNSILEGPTYTDGNATIVMSTGTDITKAITTPTKIATITFKAIAPTGGTPIQVSFTSQTTVTATITDPETNVLASSNPAFINLAGSAPTSTPTPAPTAPTSTPTPIPGTTGTSAPNQPPVCTALNVDRITTGAVPFSIAFTANGNDPGGTIRKVTFDFGDGPVQDVIQSGGIGTNSVSVQTSHTYNNPGTFKASATVTDNNNAISNPASCTQTITVTQSSVTGVPAQPTTPVVVTPTNAPIIASPTPIVRTSITPPGPGDKILSAGIAGAIVAIVGALLFLAL